uniref:Uncharacterized protein n=1 Tax=Arundo donax TaxID=35708 RepID=A0A0A9GPB0_ARUDO
MCTWTIRSLRIRRFWPRISIRSQKHHSHTSTLQWRPLKLRGLYDVRLVSELRTYSLAFCLASSCLSLSPCDISYSRYFVNKDVILFAGRVRQVARSNNARITSVSPM